MCGIVGMQAVSRERVSQAVHALGHRGPDAAAVWTDGERLTLGHSRLAVIDLDAAANQPMHCRRTGNVVVYNGEIYNYRTLRRELQDLGWTFGTRSDTEVLLACYAQWGTSCFERLQGMFALAIADRGAGRVVLARDRIGKKPLFYTLAEGKLAWASEIKALFRLRPSLARRGNLRALRSYVDLGYVAGAQTIYADICKLPAGHYATFDLGIGRFELAPYWRLPCPDSGKPPGEQEAAERLEQLLLDAIRLRLESDVPLGMFLSGGLDSGIVATLAGRLKPGLLPIPFA
jgi:asparagine synthase (glutamine-hydrolysing)